MMVGGSCSCCCCCSEEEEEEGREDEDEEGDEVEGKDNDRSGEGNPMCVRRAVEAMVKRGSGAGAAPTIKPLIWKPP
jgi:hypothetical protein